jgi:hypothetical protein
VVRVVVLAGVVRTVTEIVPVVVAPCVCSAEWTSRTTIVTPTRNATGAA